MSDNQTVANNNEQIINDIESLQKMEQQLLNYLESNTTLNSQQQQNIIEKMNQITNMRINLYQTLSGINNFYQSALSSSVGSLQNKVASIGIVEDELNRSKRRLQNLESERNNKIRLVEINNYYGDKYAEHTQLMKIVIFILIPIIILAMLNKQGILPNTLFFLLFVIVCLVGSFFFWKRVASILMRDNMNYQEYNWRFTPPKTGAVINSYDPWGNSSMNGTCIGEICCSDGQTYDNTLNKCIVSSNISSSLAEGQNSNAYDLDNVGSFYKDVSNNMTTNFNTVYNSMSN